MRVERAFSDFDFERLTNLVQPNDGTDRLFVTEQPGRVRVLTMPPAAASAFVFLDISAKVSEANNEEGLLGIAFDPDFKTNGYFYLYYAASGGERRTVLSRFSVSDEDPNRADPESEMVILEIPQPFGNHKGGQLAFGPDGFLYLGLGDGGSAGDPHRNGQNRGALLGKILRLDVRNATSSAPYRVPPDNPFAGVAGAREEIWAYGLRNPWRFSFDTETGDLWVGDVGQNQWEEIDIVRRGRNYGWNVMEGPDCFSPSTGCDRTGLETPIAHYETSEGCAITGGYVYRGSALSMLAGAYIYADYCSGKIWGLRYDGRAVTEQALLVDTSLQITSFGMDRTGSLYVLSRNQGVYRLMPVS